MNVMFVIPTLGQGGAQRVLVNLANSLVEFNSISSEESQSVRYKISIATFASSKVVPHHAPSEKISVHYLGGISGSRTSGGGLLQSTFKLRDIIKKTQPQIVVAFQDIAIFPAILSCVGSQAKLVISERQDTRFYRLAFVRRFLRWVMYRLANRVVVQTEFVKNQMPVVVRDRTTVIPNASPNFDARPLKTSGSAKRIISVGRLETQKNFSLLVEATELAFRGREDWSLVIYGEGSLRSSLEEQISKLRLGNKVQLAGLTSSVVSELANSDIFVFPSIYEGFPNALAEASSVGLPCIAYKDVSGVKELIENGVNGLLLSSDQRHALPLAAAMKELMDDPDKRERMGREGVSLASRYQQDSIFNNWESLLRNVM